MEKELENHPIKYKWKYRDNSNNEHRVIFECEAADIMEADELYKKAIGQNPEKQNYIGRSREDWCTKEAWDKP